MRESILEEGFVAGFYFQASEFADVSADWAINFSIWSLNKAGSSEYRLDALRLSADDADCVATVIAGKHMYSSAGKEIRKYIPANKCKQTEVVYTMSNGISVTDKAYSQPINTLATLFMDTPRVGYNTRFVTLINRRMKGNKIAISICKDNFDAAVAVFAARKLISGEFANWTNNSDDYMTPRSCDELTQFEHDSIVYSLFHNVNNITSMRNIADASGVRDIFNEFFWMSREDIYSLATGSSSPDTLAPAVANDVLKYGQSGNRFVYEKLQTVHMSDDAMLLLDMATAILIDTMKYREDFNRKHPEYHINSWDAGWYQVKAVAKEYIPDKLKLFNELYKKLEDRMRPLVYELGFLYK